MRYQMKQRWFSLAENFAIRDEMGNEVLEVRGKVFSWGDKLSLRDPAGNELAFIDQQVLAWGPTFHVSRGGQPVATIKKKLFSLFKERFSVDVPGPDDLEAEGNFLDHEYSITRGGAVVATVSKAWFSFTDTYGIEIAPGQDEVLILAIAVVIDLALHNSDD